MLILYLFLESLALTILTLWISRAPKDCEFFGAFPKKYIVNDKISGIVLLKPKYKVTKWFFALTIQQLLSSLAVLIVGVLFWSGVEVLAFFNTYNAMKLYLIYFGISFILVGIINSIMIQKHIFKTNKK